MTCHRVEDVGLSLMFFFGVRVMSVSYTHLDVYKRQITAIGLSAPLGKSQDNYRS